MMETQKIKAYSKLSRHAVSRDACDAAVGVILKAPFSTARLCRSTSGKPVIQQWTPAIGAAIYDTPARE